LYSQFIQYDNGEWKEVDGNHVFVANDVCENVVLESSIPYKEITIPEPMFDEIIVGSETMSYVVELESIFSNSCGTVNQNSLNILTSYVPDDKVKFFNATDLLGNCRYKLLYESAATSSILFFQKLRKRMSVTKEEKILNVNLYTIPYFTLSISFNESDIQYNDTCGAEIDLVSTLRT
jgi:hypothetical protein